MENTHEVSETAASRRRRPMMRRKVSGLSYALRFRVRQSGRRGARGSRNGLPHEGHRNGTSRFSLGSRCTL